MVRVWDCSFHLFETNFFLILLLNFPCCVFILIKNDSKLLYLPVILSFIIFPVERVTPFKIKKRTIFYVTMKIEVSISDSLCLFNIGACQRWEGEWEKVKITFVCQWEHEPFPSWKIASGRAPRKNFNSISVSL